MSHLFNPANPTLLIQTGLEYFVGRAGLCTQLSPIFAGQGTGAGNPAANSPGQPNTGSPGSGPYNPIFPPFPGGFTGPALNSFNITIAHDIPSGFTGYFAGDGLGGPGFPSNVHATGTLNSGGGQGGIVLDGVIFTGNGGAFNLYLRALKSLFAVTPFTAFNTFWHNMNFPGHNGVNQLIANSGPGYPGGGGTVSNATYWGAQWFFTPAGTATAWQVADIIAVAVS